MQKQTADDVDQIVHEKIRQTSNKKTLEQMQNAINEINHHDAVDKKLAVIGLFLLFIGLAISAYVYL